MNRTFKNKVKLLRMLKNVSQKSLEINKLLLLDKEAKLNPIQKQENNCKASRNQEMLQFNRANLKISDLQNSIQQINKVQGQCYWLSKINLTNIIVIHNFRLIIMQVAPLSHLQSQVASIDFVLPQE